MMESIAETLGISPTAGWSLLALIALQLSVQIWALVDLVRRRRVRYGMKWLWALAIVLGGNMLIGPIVYAVFGRNVPEPADDAGLPAAVGGERARHAADVLYGDAGEDR